MGYHFKVDSHCLMVSHGDSILVWVFWIELVSFLLLVFLLSAPFGNPMGVLIL